MYMIPGWLLTMHNLQWRSTKESTRTIKGLNGKINSFLKSPYKLNFSLDTKQIGFTETKRIKKCLRRPTVKQNSKLTSPSPRYSPFSSAVRNKVAKTCSYKYGIDNKVWRNKGPFAQHFLFTGKNIILLRFNITQLERMKLKTNIQLNDETRIRV